MGRGRGGGHESEGRGRRVRGLKGMGRVDTTLVWEVGAHGTVFGVDDRRHGQAAAVPERKLVEGELLRVPRRVHAGQEWVDAPTRGERRRGRSGL